MALMLNAPLLPAPHTPPPPPAGSIHHPLLLGNGCARLGGLLTVTLASLLACCTPTRGTGPDTDTGGDAWSDRDRTSSDVCPFGLADVTCSTDSRFDTAEVQQVDHEGENHNDYVDSLDSSELKDEAGAALRLPAAFRTHIYLALFTSLPVSVRSAASYAVESWTGLAKYLLGNLVCGAGSPMCDLFFIYGPGGNVTELGGLAVGIIYDNMNFHQECYGNCLPWPAFRFESELSFAGEGVVPCSPSVEETAQQMVALSFPSSKTGSPCIPGADCTWYTTPFVSLLGQSLPVTTEGSSSFTVLSTDSAAYLAGSQTVTIPWGSVLHEYMRWFMADYTPLGTLLPASPEADAFTSYLAHAIGGYDCLSLADCCASFVAELALTPDSTEALLILDQCPEALMKAGGQFSQGLLDLDALSVPVRLSTSGGAAKCIAYDRDLDGILDQIGSSTEPSGMCAWDMVETTGSIGSEVTLKFWAEGIVERAEPAN